MHCRHSFLFILFAGLFSWQTSALAASPPHHKPDSKKAFQRDKSPEAVAMNKLADSALEEAVKVVAKSGSLYPFGKLLDDDGKIRTFGYHGDPKKAPPADKWMNAMVWQIRKLVAEKPHVLAAVVLELHKVKTKQGETIPGIWALVDHRNHRPWALFLPFVKGTGKDKGKRVPGKLVYYATKQQLFLDGGKGKKPGADKGAASK